jgi:chromosomal replication initiation ATPase DnaA
MEDAQQLALELGHRSAQGRDDFYVSPCNAEAVGWIDRWPDWPTTGLALWGPSACGKSHLAAVWRSRSGAALADFGALRAFEPPAILAGRSSLVLDDEPAAALAIDLEEPLLHLHNLVAERGGNLLLVGGSPPARWPIALADLSSRLRAMNTVPIAAPDDALLSAVLTKQFRDRQIAVTSEVVAYAVARMERSFAAAKSLVDALDREALAQRRRIGIPLLRDVLARQAG